MLQREELISLALPVCHAQGTPLFANFIHFICEPNYPPPPPPRPKNIDFVTTLNVFPNQPTCTQWRQLRGLLPLDLPGLPQIGKSKPSDWPVDSLVNTLFWFHCWRCWQVVHLFVKGTCCCGIFSMMRIEESFIGVGFLKQGQERINK